MNPENGRWMQHRFDFIDKDLKVEPLGDGTVTLTVLLALRGAVTTSDGVRLADRGMRTFEVRWDYKTETGTFVRDLRQAGQFDLDGRDWCSDVQAFVG